MRISRNIAHNFFSAQSHANFVEDVKDNKMRQSPFLLVFIEPIAMQSLKSEVGGPFEFPFYSETFL